jgi:hypothetical protein
MNSERSEAYTRVMKTLNDEGPAKLFPAEMQVIRTAADALLFDGDAYDELAAVEDLAQQLVDADRWLPDHARRLVDDELDLCDQPLDPDVGNGAAEAVPRAEVGSGIASQPVDLPRGNQPPVTAVARRLDAPIAVPAPQVVEADSEPLGRLARRVNLPWHCLGTLA